MSESLRRVLAIPDAAKKKRQIPDLARNPGVSSFDTVSGGSAIYRKASCVCGGGCPNCQAKSSDLKVSDPSDAAEIEADRIADTVMRMPAGNPAPAESGSTSSGTIHREFDASNEEEKEETVQRKPLSGSSGIPAQSPAHVHDAVGSGGRPLDQRTRGFFESRMGYDLGGVRIHTDSTAGISARAINAKAYTLGGNIVFGSGQYSPDSESGRHLLAHELAHVVQQRTNHDPALQRRTFREDFATIAFLRGPVWNVHLTITNAPEEDSERLDNFILACHDGALDAARSLGETSSVSTREIRIRIAYSARLNEQAVSQRAFDLAVASLPKPAARAETRPADRRSEVTHLPPDPSEAPVRGETDDQRIRRQANASLRQLSNTVADAGSEGFNRIVLSIENNGREIIPSFYKEDQLPNRPSRDLTSAASVRDFLGVYFDRIVQGRGRWQIIFTRQGNSMSFSRFDLVPEQVPVSDEDELRALGIPNRREIYAQIMAETKQQVIEAGIMIASFGAEQLVLWMVGGVLFRGLGILGRAAFPKLMGLISRGAPAALGSALEVLSVSEKAEFGILMQRVETGTLSAVERSRLGGLLTKVESALPGATTAAELVGSIRIPRVARLAGSNGRMDAELIRRAAEIRATQAGLSLDAFTSYNVAVARVRTANGEIVYLDAGNLPGALHSEEYILAQLKERSYGFAGARVEQIFSERIPCSNCDDIIRRYFGEGVDVFYAVGNQPNRGRLLMEAYGL
jgi:hypothetical protein